MFRKSPPADRTTIPASLGLVYRTGEDNEIDELTRQICDMYTKYPYPLPQARGSKLKELRNLLTIFSMENRYDLRGKSILDAGTGTGHRTIEAAAVFKETNFVAVDVSDASLRIARETAVHERVQNVTFRKFNLMEAGEALGTYDMILCMWVLHHLSNPAQGLRNLVGNLSGEGVIVLYMYGKYGARERMRRKQILSLLLNEHRNDFDRGIRLVKELGFDLSEYGWDLDFDDEELKQSCIVDAYLNVNETLFEADGIFDLMRSSGLYGFLVYGLTIEKRGFLFDARLHAEARGVLETTNVAAQIPSPMAQEAYGRLSLSDKYRLIDQLFQPNGYTVIGFKAGAVRHFVPHGRVLSNALTISAL